MGRPAVCTRWIGSWSEVQLSAHGGDAIGAGEYHPVVARSSPDEFRSSPFCDERCPDERAER